MPPRKSKKKAAKKAAPAQAAAPAKEEPQAAPASAVDDAEDDVEEAEQEPTSKSDQSAAHLKNLSAGTETESKRDMSGAAESLSKASQKLQEERKKQKQALAAVQVEAADIKLISKEMDVSSKVAEAELRKNGGDVVATLTAMVAV
eukprot:m.16426 g.16426  ORF g.16426 m.16426 type:complete len:146 (-) comp7075_c0_seq1:208-645(-)